MESVGKIGRDFLLFVVVNLREFILTFNGGFPISTVGKTLFFFLKFFQLHSFLPSVGGIPLPVDW